MKKLVLFICVSFLFSGYVNAQFVTKGSILANGSVKFNATKDSDTEESNIGIDFTTWVGYAVADHIIVGPMLDIGVDKYKDGSTGTDYVEKSTEILIGPMGRYYFDPGYFIHADVGFGVSNFTQEYSGQSDFKSNYSVLKWMVGAGYAIRISDAALFEPIVAFQSNHLKQTEPDPSPGDGKYTHSGVFVGLSFTVILKRP